MFNFYQPNVKNEISRYSHLYHYQKNPQIEGILLSIATINLDPHIFRVFYKTEKYKIGLRDDAQRLLTYPTSWYTLRHVYAFDHLSPMQFPWALKEEVRINLAWLSNKILFTTRRDATRKRGCVTRTMAIFDPSSSLIILRQLLSRRWFIGSRTNGLKTEKLTAPSSHAALFIKFQ